jgi:hypothetical protein
MELRDLLYGIGSEYNRTLPFTSAAQQLLKAASHELAPLVPGGYTVQGSGGRGVPAIVPWIAIFDPDETDTARKGMYLVYLFDAQMKTAVLSLNQGVTDVIERYGAREGRERLARQATAIRTTITATDTSDLKAIIDLKSRASLPVHYEYGNIAAKSYELTDLPDNASLEADLIRLVHLYQAALQARNELRLTTHDTIVTTTPHTAPGQPEGVFKPKSDREYIQHLEGKKLVKSRKHETLVKDYGEFVTDNGYRPATNVHPRDLILDRQREHWLVEAKIVYQGNGVRATREALAQLLMYRSFLYKPDRTVSLLALFNEDIGLLCEKFLESFNIASVWKSPSGWVGSPLAYQFELCASRCHRAK